MDFLIPIAGLAIMVLFFYFMFKTLKKKKTDIGYAFTEIMGQAENLKNVEGFTQRDPNGLSENEHEELTEASDELSKMLSNLGGNPNQLNDILKARKK